MEEFEYGAEMTANSAMVAARLRMLADALESGTLNVEGQSFAIPEYVSLEIEFEEQYLSEEEDEDEEGEEGEEEGEEPEASAEEEGEEDDEEDEDEDAEDAENSVMFEIEVELSWPVEADED